LIYIGMIIFAMIRQRIIMWRNPKTIKDQISAIEDDSLSFFFELKKNQPKDDDKPHKKQTLNQETNP
jgi:hypothetical protein